jgi:hypothetical protein
MHERVLNYQSAMVFQLLLKLRGYDIFWQRGWDSSRSDGSAPGEDRHVRSRARGVAAIR